MPAREATWPSAGRFQYSKEWVFLRRKMRVTFIFFEIKQGKMGPQIWTCPLHHCSLAFSLQSLVYYTESVSMYKLGSSGKVSCQPTRQLEWHPVGSASSPPLEVLIWQRCQMRGDSLCPPQRGIRNVLPMENAQISRYPGLLVSSTSFCLQCLAFVTDWNGPRDAHY